MATSRNRWTQSAAVAVGILVFVIPTGHLVASAAQTSEASSSARRIDRYDLVSHMDGVPISLVVERALASSTDPVPVVILASPYFGPLEDGVRPQHPHAAFLADLLVPSGYAVAFVATRGTSTSGGCMDAQGLAERIDLDQAVTWLADQPWSTGAIGMFGLSYDGAAPWMVASLGNVHLKTIVPVAGFTDLHDALFLNGTATTTAPAFTASTYVGGSLLPFRAAPRHPEDIARSADCPAAVDGMVATEWSLATGSRADPVGYWQARDSRPGVLASYRGSVLVVHGLSDPLVSPTQVLPWHQELARGGIPTKLLLGQWQHTTPDQANGTALEGSLNASPRPDFPALLLRWFDRWLKRDPRAETGPPVEVADATGAWRTEGQWPPPRFATVGYDLTAAGTLSESASDEPASFVLLPNGGRHLSSLGLAIPDPPSTVAVFRSEPWPNGGRVAGLPRLTLTATPLGPGGYLRADLRAETPRDAFPLGWGQVDLRDADGDGDPSTVEPGRSIVARLQLQPLDAIVPPGARVVVELSVGTIGANPANGWLPGLPTPIVIQVGSGPGGLEFKAWDRGP